LPEPGDEGDRDGGQDGCTGLPGDTMYLLAQSEACQALNARPDDAAGTIEDEEAAPGHPVDAGEQRCEGAQYRDEAAEEDDLAAVLEEEVLTEL
jgi:hypothetical protein